MKVVIPFVRHTTPPFAQVGSLRPEVRALGESVGADFVDLTGDNYGYSRLLARLWSEAQPFILLEEDVLPTVAMLRAMWSCDRVWCSGWYEQNGQRVGQTLACVRFSAAALSDCPNAAVAPLLWTQIDLAVLPNLTGCFGPAHLHDPAVRHLHQ